MGVEEQAKRARQGAEASAGAVTTELPRRWLQ